MPVTRSGHVAAAGRRTELTDRAVHQIDVLKQSQSCGKCHTDYVSATANMSVHTTENPTLTVRGQPFVEVEAGWQVDHHLQVGIGQFALEDALLQIELRIGGILVAIALLAARFAAKTPQQIRLDSMHHIAYATKSNATDYLCTYCNHTTTTATTQLAYNIDNTAKHASSAADTSTNEDSPPTYGSLSGTNPRFVCSTT